MTTSENPQALAEATANSMYARDHATQALGIKIVAIKPGVASMQMVVQKTMLNGHQTCHGGYIFTLADSAFAFACNSYNIQAVEAERQLIRDKYASLQTQIDASDSIDSLTLVVKIMNTTESVTIQ